MLTSRLWLQSVLGTVRPGTGALDGTQEGAVEVFVDGELVEVFFRGEVATMNFAKAQSQDVALKVGGADAVVHMDAWSMSASVTGGPQ